MARLPWQPVRCCDSHTNIQLLDERLLVGSRAFHEFVSIEIGRVRSVDYELNDSIHSSGGDIGSPIENFFAKSLPLGMSRSSASCFETSRRFPGVQMCHIQKNIGSTWPLQELINDIGVCRDDVPSSC